MSVNTGPVTCQCQMGYRWNTATSSCVIGLVGNINCNLISNSTGSTADPNVCSCQNGFYWNGQVCYLNCSMIANSTGINTNSSGCNCNIGLTFINWKCTKNCGLYNNTIGVNPATGDCMCKWKSYRWRVDNGCNLDCSLAAYTKSNKTKKG